MGVECVGFFLGGGGDILSMRSHVGGLQIFPTRGVHPTNRGLFAQTVVSKFTTRQQATLPPPKSLPLLLHTIIDNSNSRVSVKTMCVCVRARVRNYSLPG